MTDRSPQSDNAESYGSIAVPEVDASFWRKLAAYAGPGYLVAVGYMDPGNWATDLAAGSLFGYRLLNVVVLSSIAAMLLQSLSAKLGIVSGMDLAQACRVRYAPWLRIPLWLICECAIIACDLAEVIGTAIALNLLFRIPLVVGVCLTGFDVLLILGLQRIGFRALEAFVLALFAIVAICFAIEIALAHPAIAAMIAGLWPSGATLTDPKALYILIGILGATVMPHNLYLHSAIIKTRRTGTSDRDKREGRRFAMIDTVIALTLALLINAAILVLSAAAFNGPGTTAVAGIEEAYRLLSPVLGAGAASTLFAVALLAAGQNSTVTATLAGQVVMQGFLDLRIAVWKRRLLTRLIALVPALAVAATAGISGTGRLLLFSQVILSLQLPFAIVPLIRMTGDRRLMGLHANSRTTSFAAWLVAATIIALNLFLVGQMI